MAGSGGWGGCSPGGSVVKNCLPVQETQETWVQSLGREDPLEAGIATHSNIIFLPGESNRTEKPGGLQSTGSQRV